jgi:hypothetical protein
MVIVLLNRDGGDIGPGNSRITEGPLSVCGDLV